MGPAPEYICNCPKPYKPEIFWWVPLRDSKNQILRTRLKTKSDELLLLGLVYLECNLLKTRLPKYALT